VYWVTTPQTCQRARATAAGKFVLSRLRTLRLDRVRLRVRDEISEAGYHQRPLLCLPGAPSYRDRRDVFQESLSYVDLIGIVLAVISLVLLMRFA
jgi:hypothetical protein